jgi:hypothetical protein
MEAKQIEITCPCCEARLLVDVRTGTLLRTREKSAAAPAGPAEGEPEGARDWSKALGRVQKRSNDAPGKLDAALDREREKRSRLDELFQKANDKLKDKDARAEDEA